MVSKLTWPAFFTWLTNNGFKSTRGDVHYMNSGWWFPELPEPLGEEARHPHIHVQQDRENPAVFVLATFGEGVYTEEPERAKARVEDLLIEWDTYQESLGGFGARMPTRVPPAEHRCEAMIRAPGDSRKNPELVQCRYAQLPGSRFCSRHQADASMAGIDAPFKTCSCGKEYTEEEWDALPYLGPPVFSEEDGKVYRLEMKNCSCGSTMGVEEQI